MPPGEEEAAGIVLSDAGWRRLAASRPDVIGQAFRIDDAFFTVTGVMAPSVTGLEPLTPDFWVAADTYEALVGPLGRSYVVGGLLPRETSVPAASDAMTAIVRNLPTDGEPASTHIVALVRPRTALIREREELAPLVLTLFVAFALMTVVACANLSGLYHARVAGRASDFAIRVALGASRGLIVRQVLLESVTLASIGGVIACAAAWLTVDRLQGHVFSIVIEAGLTMAPVSVDWSTGLYTMALAVAVGGACALTPALAARSVAAAGGGVARGPGRSHRALQRLVVAQAAISLTLLLIAGVVVSAAAARLLWPGIDPVGQHVDLDRSEEGAPHWERREVIGVAADALAGFFFEGRDLPMLYLPAAAASPPRLCRLAGPPGWIRSWRSGATESREPLASAAKPDAGRIVYG